MMDDLNNTGIDVEEFLEFYLLDSQEQIDRLGAGILDLERDNENIGLINELFRSAHSLKGSSGTMGFASIVEVTHAAEDLLDRVRQGKLTVTNEVVDVLLEVTDVVREMLVQVEARAPVQHDAEDLVERIHSLAKGTVRGDSASPLKSSNGESKDSQDFGEKVEFSLDENDIHELQEAALCGRTIYHITVILDDSALMKTVRAIMAIQRVQEMGKVLSVAPSIEEMEKLEEEESLTGRFSILLASNDPKDEIYNEIFQVSDVAEVLFYIYSRHDISMLSSGINVSEGKEVKKKEVKEKTVKKKETKGKTVKEKTVEEKTVKTKTVKGNASEEEIIPEKRTDKQSMESVTSVTMPKDKESLGSDGGRETSGSTGVSEGAGSDSGGARGAGSSGGRGSGSGDARGPGSSGGGGSGSTGGQVPEVSNQVHTIRVDTDRMDNLINMVGEMVITRARLVKIGDDLKNQFPSDPLVGNLNDTNVYLGRLMNDLQESAMRLRMVPVGTVFSRYPRLVRDFCRKTGKKIDLILYGEETEMDKTVIEQIGDPLTHLIRNCVDHGIEAPDVRVAAGKPEVGRIDLKAYHEGNHIAIVISDDGAGLDTQKIFQKAVRNGLANEHDELSEREIANFIFLPGFSTADQVTDISGRGVGMDVVKRALSSLGGTIDIRAKPGEGTIFTIRLPLTLAIIQALLVDICGEIYAVPLSSVQETLLVQNEEVRTVGGIKMVKLRGNTLPLLSLKNRFGLPEDETQENVFVVVVGIGDRLLGLMVDELKGQQEIVLKTLGEDLGSLPGISGATILGDGKVTLILDIASLMQDVLTY